MEETKKKLTTAADNNLNKQKECFIITPVGSDNSEIRRAAEGVIDSGIFPVLQEYGYKVNVPHRLWGSGSITKNVINLIVNNELTIANLTGLNPNVMYELGIRHSARKPVIHICETGTELPFDIKPERTIFYSNDMAGIIDFQKKLKQFIKVVMQENNLSNPVYDAIESATIMEKASGDAEPLRYILAKLEELTGQVNRINRSNLEFNKKDALEDSRRLYDMVKLESIIEKYRKNNEPIPMNLLEKLEKLGDYTNADNIENHLLYRFKDDVRP